MTARGGLNKRILNCKKIIEQFKLTIIMNTQLQYKRDKTFIFVEDFQSEKLLDQERSKCQMNK